MTPETLPAAHSQASRLRPPQAPTRARHRVIVFAVVLAIIQYIDRVCISKAAPADSAGTRLHQRPDGLRVLGIHAGLRAVRDPRRLAGRPLRAGKVLMRVVLWWSFFTAATGWVWKPRSMMAVRFLFGAGEAGCFPNITKAFSTWLPQTNGCVRRASLARRALGRGVHSAAGRLGARSWARGGARSRCSGCSASCGRCVLVLVPGRPARAPGVNAAELELMAGSKNLASTHARVPWRMFFTVADGLAAVAPVLRASATCWYFYITWLPDVSGTYAWARVGPHHAAVLAGLPLFGGGFGSLISRVHRGVARAATGQRRTCAADAGGLRVRRGLGDDARGDATADPSRSHCSCALAGLFNDFVLPCAWGACMDVGGRFAGTFSGSMNMMGNLGGFVAPIVIGYILDATGSWNLTFTSPRASICSAPSAGCGWIRRRRWTGVNGLPVVPRLLVRVPRPLVPRAACGAPAGSARSSAFAEATADSTKPKGEVGQPTRQVPSQPCRGQRAGAHCVRP